MNTRDIIAALGTAQEVGALFGVSREAVKKWRQRDAVPAEHDVALVRLAAERLGVTLSFEQLAKARAARTIVCTPEPIKNAATLPDSSAPNHRADARRADVEP